MPKKKKQTKNLAFTFDPASPPGAEGQALLDALRSNLSLLGEIAMRYEVNNKPERPEDPPSIGSPATSTACWGRRCPPWPRSSCGCCCSTPTTTSSASAWSTRGT